MDNRFRFLYPVYTELWGRGEITRAGRGKPGAAAGLGGRQIPLRKAGRKRTERKGREAGEGTAEKSRYSCIRARTVNRHRWMRRES